MVKVIGGSALGGLLAAAIALLVAGPMRGAPASTDASAFQAAEAVAPAIQCEPYQDAAMTRVLVNGREATALTCVDRLDPRVAAPSGAVLSAAPASLAPQVYAPSAGMVSYPSPAVLSQQPARRTASARPAVYQADDDVVRYEPDRREEKRSVAKTALIIGGSAGAGAGVGAIAGGRKGALIGAAIGGGAASIFEAMKR